jgi:hypothetical protein
MTTQPSQPAAPNPAPQPPPVDPGNALIAETPAQLTTAHSLDPPGRLVLTIRTPSTTLTVLLTRSWAETWAKQIHDGAVSLSGLILPTMPMPDMNGQPK